MPIQEILQLGNPRLRELSETVNDATAPEITALISDLRDTLAHWRETTGYGRGIAAPQIGVPRRVIFLEVDRETPWPLINPTIVETSAETMVVWDGCLSFLAVFCQVERQSWIVVRYQDPGGEWRQLRAEGDLSELLQHEIDHLDGVLTVDRMVDVRSLCTRGEFERRYRADSPYG